MINSPATELLYRFVEVGKLDQMVKPLATELMADCKRVSGKDGQQILADPVGGEVISETF